MGQRYFINMWVKYSRDNYNTIVNDNVVIIVIAPVMTIVTAIFEAVKLRLDYI